MKTFDALAQKEYEDYVIYKRLLAIEQNADFHHILEEIIAREFEHFTFWKKFSAKKEFTVPWHKIRLVIMLRIVLGLTFILRYFEREEERAIEDYEHLLGQTPKDMHHELRRIISHERHHEKELMKLVKEEKVEFISSIILGLNDGLIELSGALVGFSFAFNNQSMVALSGLITGTAASLSMASSAYMQARHEEGKDAKKAALYTGVSYLIVVMLLVLPFFLTNAISTSLMSMAVITFVIILSISYYTAVIFERSFKKQFSEMALFSIGVAIISFIVGTLLERIIGSN